MRQPWKPPLDVSRKISTGESRSNNGQRCRGSWERMVLQKGRNGRVTGLHKEHNDHSGTELLRYCRRERHLDFFPGIFWGWCSAGCSEIKEERGVRQWWHKSKPMLQMPSCTEKNTRDPGQGDQEQTCKDGGRTEWERSNKYSPGLKWLVEYIKKQSWVKAVQLTEH